MNQEIRGETYAKRPINIHQAPKRTGTATKTKGQGRAQEPTKAEKPAESSIDEMAELREHAAAQAALFNNGVEETNIAEESTPGGRIGE